MSDKKFLLKSLSIAAIVGLSLCANSSQAETIKIPATPTLTNASAYTIGNSGTIPLIQYEIDNQTGKIVSETAKYFDINKKTYSNGTLTYNWDSNGILTVTKSGASAAGTQSNKDYIGDYIGNNGKSSSYTEGGALTITSTTNNITGDFIGNKATEGLQRNGGSSKYAQGGAIQVYKASIENIQGNFIGNNATGRHSEGIIYLTASNVGTISGDFIGNYLEAAGDGDAYGIIRLYNSQVGDIIGDYIGNYVTSKNKLAQGAGIENGYSTINNIRGNYINNYSKGGSGTGGAIDSYGSSTIKSIIGNFINNALECTSSFGYGGGIANRGSTITSINGNFINNHIIAYSSALGGGLYNTGTISSIKNASFYKNYAKTTSSSGTTQGGAIWTSNNLNFSSNNGYNSRFSGNYVQKGTSGTKLNEAIYVNSYNATLTFNATTNGQYTFYDYINGVSNYKVRFTGDSTGKVNLYNDVKNGAVSTDTVTMNLANGELHNYSMYTLNSNANTKWNIDIDINNKSADTITTTTSTTASKVTLDNFNFITNDFSSISPSTFKIKILNTQNSNLQLALSAAAQAQLGDTEYEMGIDAVTTYDQIETNTNWSDTYNKHVTGNALYGTLGLATTSTTNDSIGITITRVVAGGSSDSSMGDTLALVNQSDLSTRNFNASDSSDSYTLNSTLGNTAAGTLNINGATDDTTHATLNLNNQDSFNLSENTTLNLNDVSLTGNTTAINVSNNNAAVNITNSVIDGTITGSKKFALKTSGITTLNNDVTNADYTNEGTTIVNGTITGTILNKNGATLNIIADNINGTVTNNGTLNLISGTNTHEINGTGATITTGNVINNAAINQAVTNTGTLTSSINNISGAITNTGTFNMSGNLSKNISGEGTTVLQSTTAIVDANRTIEGNLDVNGKTIAMNDSANETLTVGKLTGNGNLTLNADATATTGTSDTIHINNTGSNSVLTITALDLTKPTVLVGEEKTSTIRVLTGNSSGANLVLSSSVSTEYNKETKVTNTDTDTLATNAISWNDNYGGWEQIETTTETLAVTSSSGTLQDSLTYIINKTLGAKNYTSKAENLAIMNTYTGTGSNNRSVSFAGIFSSPQNGVYTLSSDLGTSAAGNYTLYGVKSGTDNTTIDLNGKNGFILSDTTNLNLNNIDIIDNTKSITNTTLATITNSAASVSLNNVTLNGNIVSTSGYSLDLKGNTTLGDSIGTATVTTDTATLNIAANTFADASVTTDEDSTFNLSGDGIKTYSFGTLNSDSGTDWAIDINFANKTADKISAGTDSSGTVTLSNLNFNAGSSPDDIPSDLVGQEFIVKILDAPSNNLQLALSDTVQGQLGDENYLIGTVTNNADDIIVADNNWNKIYNKYTQQVDTYGKLGLATTSTTNDSIGVTYHHTTTLPKVYNGVLGDTLALINSADIGDRNFTTNDKNAIYNVNSDLGTTASGELTIQGAADGETRSTLDFDGHTGFVIDNADTTLTLKNVEVTGADTLVSATAPADNVKLVLDNVNLDGTNGGITTFGDIDITGNSTISDDITVLGANSTVDVDGTDEVTLDSAMTGGAGKTLTLHDGTVNLTDNASISAFDLTLQDVDLNLANENSLAGLNTTFNGANNLNMANGSVGTLALGNVDLNGILTMQVDADLANKQMDKLTATSAIIGAGGKINVDKINLLLPTTDTKTSLLFTNNLDLANAVSYTGEGTIAYSPIFKYQTSYNVKDGQGYFDFVLPSQSGGESPAASDFNPSVLTSSVTAQAGAMGAMNQGMFYAFEHGDTFMNNPAMDRFAKIYGNSVALSTDYNENREHIDIDHENKGVWVKPYTVFENINLKNGPKVDVINYGTLIGFDSEIHKLKKGWANTATAYIGYNGSQLKYSGVDTSTNGGILGLTETFYKGNFWTAVTATTGASFAEANTMYGYENMTTLMAGIANKTGYNFEFNEGKFIVQPRLLLAYSFLNTFDYTNAAGVRINSDPLHTIQINPALKFIGNIKGWQPYASVGMVWNVMDQTKATANGVKLPEMHIKPYVEYGVGLQRCWNDKFSAYGQAMIRNGGRNGIALTGGFRWALGRGSSPKKEKVMNPDASLRGANATWQSKTNDSNNKKILNKTLNQVQNDKSVQNDKVKAQNNKVSLKTKIDRFFAKMNGENI